MEDSTYTRWVKRLPCCACNMPADDPHHIYGVLSKGTSTKVPDYLTIPLCRPCHDELHADVEAWEEKHGTQEHHAMITMLRAIYEEVLRVGC